MALPLGFPAELNDALLRYMSGRDLLVCRMVCKMWCQIADRFLYQRYRRHIPRSLVKELAEEIGDDDPPFATLYALWLGSKVKNKGTIVKVLRKQTPGNVSCLEIHKTTVVMGQNDGVIVACPLLAGDEYRSESGDGKVHRIAVMNSGLVLSTGDTSIRFHHLGIQGKYPGRWKELKPSIQVKVVGGCSRNANLIAVNENRFVIALNTATLSVYAVMSYSDKSVEVMKETDVYTKHSNFMWQLWGDQLGILTEQGKVLVWDVKTDKCKSMSPAYRDIMYGNPCWMFRNAVLCSTSTSRSLLAECNMSEAIECASTDGVVPSEYWHIQGGCHWLIGKCDEKLRKYPLGIHASHGLEEDVLCVSMKRQLLVCGTASGKLLLYQVNSSSTGLHYPGVVKASTNAIRRVRVSFDTGYLYILIATDKFDVECIRLKSVLIHSAART